MPMSNDRTESSTHTPKRRNRFTTHSIRVLATLLLLTLAGCSSTPREVKTQQDMSGRIVALEVEEALVNEDEVYVHFHGALPDDLDDGPQDDFYARAETEDLFELSTDLKFLTKADWQEKTSEAGRIPVLTADVLDHIAVDVLKGIMPEATGDGITVRFLSEGIFVYRDDDGLLHATRIQDRPLNTRIIKAYTPNDLKPLLIAEIEERLAQRDVSSRQVFIVTGDRGPGASLFLHVDLDEQKLAYLTLRGKRPANLLEPVGMTVDVGAHVVLRSFFLELLRAPFSLVFRGVFYVGYTAVDLINLDSLLTSIEEPPPLYEGPGMDLNAWEDRLDELTKSKTYPGIVTRHLIDGDEFFTRLKEKISEATTSIDMRTYLFDNDDFAVEMADLLRDRSRDVKVKVLVDGLGTIVAATDDSPGLPPDFKKPAKIGFYLTSGSKVKFRSQTNPLLVGDHAKTTIIDDTTAYIGGMNIAREYRYEWHDYMAEIEGPVVDALRQSFDDRWSHAGVLGDWGYFFYRLFVPRIKVRGEYEGEEYPIRILETTPNESQIYRAQIEAMRTAKKYIYIENLYFSNTLFLYELIKARQRGVDVRLIMPIQGNQAILTEAAVVTANRLHAAGIRVYLYPRMSHVKAAVYDGWACVGSANFDKLSFRLNYEINLGFSEPAVVDELIERMFEADFEMATELTEPLGTDWRHYFSELIANQL
ncbi:MAG: phosphatidylserine/phosphatidylglycerophosphate/cardiolipin synthase family protein [Planctomycetota bacterium]|nr:phosphatidylserine/phosphatidylglycerophosphate/cardiolipin synthase family protein [Planctomycetota bacterium]